ncbi:unnamed protein product [Dovyalis caffra]|uniref:F-box protein n=1 Tax=Dovyalis caffra TaxID=77055 RepID=A0AAV1SNK9_9ROSI|nr:unnamed protein product [Dovyalis caffra]
MSILWVHAIDWFASLYSLEYIYDQFFLWNPSTGVYRRLPNPDNHSGKESYAYGFDNDSSYDDKCKILEEDARGTLLELWIMKEYGVSRLDSLIVEKLIIMAT